MRERKEPTPEQVRLTPGLRMMCATSHLERQVRRHGFQAYLTRFGVELAEEAERGYRLIGAFCHAELVRAARVLHLTSKSVEPDRFAVPPEGFAVLEDALRDLDPAEPLKLDYQESHPDDFNTRVER